jgi:hypothetical protein
VFNLNLKKQGLILGLGLAFFLARISYASQAIPSEVSKKIIDFSLFNYDNLIADYYEEREGYLGQLVFLIHKGTALSTADIREIVVNENLASEKDPVDYMLAINKKIKELHGYYFVDD